MLVVSRRRDARLAGRMPRSDEFGSPGRVLVVGPGPDRGPFLGIAPPGRPGPDRFSGGMALRDLPAFHLIRVPARFNLFASLCAAALIAAAGLKHLLARLERPGRQVGRVRDSLPLAIADLAMVPFRRSPSPPCRPLSWIRGAMRGELLLELPLLASTRTARRTRCAATGSRFIACGPPPAIAPTPTPATTRRSSTTRPSTPTHPEGRLPPASRGGLVRDQRRCRCPRLPLAVPDREPGGLPRPAPRAGSSSPSSGSTWIGSEALLRDAIVHEDSAATVYARSRLKPPSRPTLIHADGWRSGGWPSEHFVHAGKSGERLGLQPRPGREPSFSWASAFLRPRTGRLLSGDRELARWHVEPGDAKTHASPPVSASCGAAFPFAIRQRRRGASHPPPRGGRPKATCRPLGAGVASDRPDPGPGGD